jgi:aspartate kinase
VSDRPILVQKFGGTSVSTAERRLQVIEHVRAAQSAGFSVAIVVSAMGRRGDPYATDTLLGLLGDGPEPREYDLIFACGEAISAAVMATSLRKAGVPAVAMTGAQAGIFTDGHHMAAEVLAIDTAHMLSVMARGEVPVVTGAQGVAPGTLEFTTLGRGGSDTSGVAVGVALAAEKVEIFTDVDGVAVADPRVVPGARFLRQVSYDAMHELARFGAGVMHPRAVAVGQKANVPLVVRSTFSNDPGTLIADVQDEAPVVGVAALGSMTTLELTTADADSALRARWEREGLMSIVDLTSGRLVVGAKGRRSEEIVAVLAERALGVGRIESDRAWVSVVGRTDALAEALGDGPAVLAGRGIDVAWAEATPHRRTYVVADGDRNRAVRALHDLAIARNHAPHRGTRPGTP